ncbi:response regulator [Deinococcus sp. PEB2-63]
MDDYADLRKLIRLTLLGPDYQFQEAASGDEALTRTREWRPVLLILDVRMPGSLNGFQVCETLKADPDLRGTAVMLVTARAQKSDLQEGVAVGADAYLVKPFSPMELLERVGTLLDRRG